MKIFRRSAKITFVIFFMLGFFALSVLVISSEGVNTVGGEVQDATFSDSVVLSSDCIYQDLTINSGTVDLNGHTLTVNGSINQTGGTINFNGGTLVVHGNYNLSGGIFEMHNDEDYFLIHGDFSSTTEEYYQISNGYRLNAGTLEVKGNMYSASKNPICASGSHKLVLSGEGAQKIELKQYMYESMQYTEIKNPLVEFVGSGGYGNCIGILLEDAKIVSADSFFGVDLNGKKLTVEKELSGYLDINLNGGKLTVNGTINQPGGMIEFNGGTIILYGDYNICGDYYSPGGIFEMHNEDDYFLIHGNFVSVEPNYYVTSYGYRLTAGTLEVKGNMYSSVENPICASGSHKLVLSGEGTQKIELNNDYTSMQYTEIKNPLVEFVGSGGYGNNLGMLSGDSVMLSVESYFVVDLNGYTLAVNGSINQTGGTINFNGGMLVVHGDYNLSGGIFEMHNDEDYFLIHGDFSSTTEEYYQISNGYRLNAGTLEVKGNMYSIWDNKLSSDGTHKLVLSGEGTQKIELNHEGYGYGLNELVLIKPIGNYVLIGVYYEKITYAYDTSYLPDSIFSNLVSFDKNTQCAFHVYSKYDAHTGINKAAVTFNGVTKETDVNGLVVFDKPSSGKADITVSKSRYHTYSQASYSLDLDTGCNYISMVPLSVKSYLIEATCDSYDVLTGTVRLDCSMNQPVYITATAESDYPISEYALMQGDHIIATSAIGVFVVNSQDFDEKTQVSIRVKNTSGAIENYGININVYNSKSQSNKLPIINSISIGKDMSIEIDEDVPVVGGMKFDIEDIDCPISLDVNKDKIKIGINVPISGIEYTRETLYAYIVKQGEDVDGYFEETLYKSKFKMDFAGYLECVFDENGNPTKVKSVAYLILKYSGNYDFHVVIGVVPVTLGVSVGASCSLVIDNIGYDFENSKFLFPSLRWTANGSIMAKVGIGVKYLSAGVYGELKNNWTGEIFPDFDFKKWTISGELGLYGRIAIFEGKWPIFETETLQVYPYQSAVSPALLSYATLNTASLYSYGEYSLIDYMSESPNSLDNCAIESDKVLENDVYKYIEPSVVTCGDTTIMAYLDYSLERTKANAQVLVYRIYDKETESWGDVIQLDDNMTADSEFSIYSDDSNIYIIYTEAKEELADDIDVYTYPEKIEIAVSIFDSETKRFGKTERITDNTYFETMPEIVLIDGVLTAVWIQNTQNDIFCANDKNSIVISRFVDGEWTAAEVLVSDLATVTNLCVNEFDNTLYIAFTTDGDCDLTTQSDKCLRVYDFANQACLDVANDEFFLDISFEKIADKNVLVWCANNNLYYTDFNGETVEIPSIFEDPLLGLDNYRFVAKENGDAVILFLKNDENARKLWAIYGNSNTNTWGAPIQLIANDCYINSYDVYFENDELSVIYLLAHVTNTGETFEESCKLIFETVEQREDLEMLSVEIDYSSVAPQNTVTVTAIVRNNGFVPVSDYKILVSDESGNVIADKDFSDIIESGKKMTLSFDFECSATIDELDYAISVTSENVSDCDNSNDSKNFALWKSDLNITAKQLVIGENNYISTIIKNDGYLPTDGKLQLLDTNGNLLASKAIKNLDYGMVEEICIDISNLGSEVSDVGLFMLKVVATQDDYNVANNETAVYSLDIGVGNGNPITCEHVYGEWSVNEETHYKICTSCGNTNDVLLHIYDDDSDTDCNVCGYIRASSTVKGDTDNDGDVDTDDAIYLLRHTLLPGMYPVVQNCDFDGSGKLDTDDAIYLLRHTLLPGMYPLK